MGFKIILNTLFEVSLGHVRSVSNKTTRAAEVTQWVRHYSKA